MLQELSTGLSLTALPTQFVGLSSTGLGDGVVRLKANLSNSRKRRNGIDKTLGSQHRRFNFAVGADFRLPTGDEFNYHGTGAFGVKPFLVASMTTKVISPHLNAGFQWNGKSYMASQYPTVKRHLPSQSQLFYAAGFDAAVSPRMTLAFDFLDQMIISGQRTLLRPFEAGGTSYTEIYFDDITRHEYNASARLQGTDRVANRSKRKYSIPAERGRTESAYRTADRCFVYLLIAFFAHRLRRFSREIGLVSQKCN